MGIWKNRKNQNKSAKTVHEEVSRSRIAMMHNKYPLTKEQRKSDDVIIIYDGENDKWLYCGEIIIDGEVVIHDGTAE